MMGNTRVEKGRIMLRRICADRHKRNSIEIFWEHVSRKIYLSDIKRANAHLVRWAFVRCRWLQVHCVYTGTVSIGL